MINKLNAMKKNSEVNPSPWLTGDYCLIRPLPEARESVP